MSEIKIKQSKILLDLTTNDFIDDFFYNEKTGEIMIDQDIDGYRPDVDNVKLLKTTTITYPNGEELTIKEGDVIYKMVNTGVRLCERQAIYIFGDLEEVIKYERYKMLPHFHYYEKCVKSFIEMLKQRPSLDGKKFLKEYTEHLEEKDEAVKEAFKERLETIVCQSLGGHIIVGNIHIEENNKNKGLPNRYDEFMELAKQQPLK